MRRKMFEDGAPEKVVLTTRQSLKLSLAQMSKII